MLMMLMMLMSLAATAGCLTSVMAALGRLPNLNQVYEKPCSVGYARGLVDPARRSLLPTVTMAARSRASITWLALIWAGSRILESPVAESAGLR